jgi:hypothetical protein
MIVKKAELLVDMGLAASISAADEARLDLVHPLAESAVRRYLQNDLGYAQHVELLPTGQAYLGDDRPLNDTEFRANAAVFVNANAGTNVLVLKHTPVWENGLEVREDVAAYAGQADSAFTDDSILTIGSDYWLDVDEVIGDLKVSRTGILHRFGVWPNEPRCVKVTYYGGANATRLADNYNALREAIMLTVAAKYYARKQNASSSGAGTVSSESLGKWSASFGSAAGSLAVQGQDMDIPHGAKLALQTLKSYRYL